VRRHFAPLLCAICTLSGGAASASAATTLLVDAPPALAGDARRVRAVNLDLLDEALARAGLTLPPRIRIVLVEEAHRLAQDVPPWIVGLASGTSDIVIFPTRVVRYPYDSLESVVRHEIVHLALTHAADGRPLPRWFHEGLAVSVDAGFGIRSRLRLFVAMLDRPGIDDVDRLFAAGAQPEAIDAYLLSAALVDDLRMRHGPGVPGAIARRVAEGTAFDVAFRLETSTTPDQAAARAWATYRRWVIWVPVVTGASAMWFVIMALAIMAFIARQRQRRRRRRQWDEEDAF
jgi:hypothetical protein